MLNQKGFLIFLCKCPSSQQVEPQENQSGEPIEEDIVQSMEGLQIFADEAEGTGHEVLSANQTQAF